MTTHAQFMAQRAAPHQNDPDPICNNQVSHVYGGFWDDVSWELYHCTRCNIIIATVGGGAHWWNYVVTNPLILAALPDPVTA